MKITTFILTLSTTLLSLSPVYAQNDDEPGFPVVPHNAPTSEVIRMAGLWMAVWGEVTKKACESTLDLTKQRQGLMADQFTLISNQTGRLSGDCRMIMLVERSAEIADPKKLAESQIIMSEFYTELSGSVIAAEEALDGLVKMANSDTQEIFRGLGGMLKRFKRHFLSGRIEKWKTKAAATNTAIDDNRFRNLEGR